MRQIKARVSIPFRRIRAQDEMKLSRTQQGLAIAHSLVVDMHSGTLAVESEVGAETTSVIRLPLEAQPEAIA